MKLKEIHRTSTFAWSPSASLPLLATGTVAGALDESFSNESQLEIWAPNFLDQDEYDLGGIGQNGPRGAINDTARFNRLAWGYVNQSRPHGVIAAGLENGELTLWDPEKILAGSDASESLILRNTIHTGPVRGLDFNPIQTNLLASGGVGGEVYIWDLKDPNKPYTPTPGSTSTKLDEITSVAWNQQVQYVLAGASSTGYTVVWDLRGKREVVALAYGGAGNTGVGGGRRGMSDIAWHPDNATRVVTASEDDSSPIIMVWDLRNARAPEKILTGHEKGVLSLSWCKQDADLLLSCGKDNRALCWNPQTSEIIGELPSADNWAFQVDWCPRNPDLLATAYFDGTIGLHSIQTTNEPAAHTPQADGADIFDAPGFARSSTGTTLSLKQPPKWLRRPASSSFGFGGKLVTVSNLPSAQGKNQSSVVHIRSVVTEQDLVERATKLQEAIAADDLKAFAETKTEGSESWKALRSLFQANSRDELVTLLGFSKAEIAARVAEAVETLKASADAKLVEQEADITEERSEPVVSFAEPEREEEAEVVSDTASSSLLGEGESETTGPSLFGEDDGPGTPQVDAGQDFFSSHIPHTNYGIDSSVAATAGSGPSSVTSEVIKNNSFKIYPADESETDRLVTKALVLGDFESAVALCLSSDRFADAILLAVRGGPDLLRKTQKAYFERRTTALPYLRLFQSIVTNDLADIVQNADLQEWQEIFVVLCTFATEEEFAGLAEQLGARLEFQFALAKSESEGEGDEEVVDKAKPFRKHATLTYLAAARLERLVSIWAEELGEEEKAYLEDAGRNEVGSYFSAHANALQTFVEKVATFRSATGYKDDDLNIASTSEDTLKTFKLATLYDRYFEYADLLATQGLLKEAAEILKLTPAAYKGTSPTVDRSSQRQRLVNATAPSPKPAPQQRAPAAPVSKATSYGVGYPHTQASAGPAQPLYPSYQPTLTHAQQHQQQQQQQVYGVGHQHQQAGSGYPTPSAYQPATIYAPTQPAQVQQPPPPPSRLGGTNGRSTPSQQPLPPPPKRDVGGWNDAPAMVSAGNKPSALHLASKPQAITSPFPNAPAVSSPGYSPSGSPYMNQGQPSTPLPPPPRPGSVARGPVPPPPPGQRIHAQPPHPGNLPPQMRPASRNNAVPPSMLMSNQGPQRQPTPSQYAPPPSQRDLPPPQGPGPYYKSAQPGPGPYGVAPAPQHQPSGPYGPPQGVQQHQQQQQAGPYGPPQGVQQQQAGPYGPPQGVQQQQQQPPPPPSGPYAPPQGGQGPPSAQGPPLVPPPPQGGRVGGAPPPPPQGGPRVPPAPARQGPPPPKYPPGDRSHIPEHVKPAVNVLVDNLNRMRETTPPNQRRLVEDLERRLNPLFDALNCETLSAGVVEQLIVLTRAMEARDRPAALAIHVDLLTRGSLTDDIGLWMAGVKQLIMRL